ncbi:MAG: RES family NAD+ phosphorylase [Lutibacter sp.]|nr:RES family NAD+ phosphorylase [Lutibacter sp.]MDT8418347.1 RES family NAD+ phosphorylase [Lutibacter sp.]
MEVFKICREKYANALNASEAANRWNKKEEFVIYAGGSRSLSALESVVHRAAINISAPYKLLTISIKDKTPIKEIKVKDLPENWNTIDSYIELQEIGSKWYRSLETLVLKVPSAIISQEYNYVINTKHHLFATNIKLEKVEGFAWDKRLL